RSRGCPARSGVWSRRSTARAEREARPEPAAMAGNELPGGALDLALGFLHLALGLVCCALGLQFLVARRLAGGALSLALRLVPFALGRVDGAVLRHCVLLEACDGCSFLVPALRYGETSTHVSGGSAG